MTDVQAAFEEFIAEKRWNRVKRVADNTKYAFASTQHAWEAWQAAFSRRTPNVTGTAPTADTPVTVTGLCATRCGECPTDASCMARRRALGLPI